MSSRIRSRMTTKGPMSFVTLRNMIWALFASLLHAVMVPLTLARRFGGTACSAFLTLGSGKFLGYFQRCRKPVPPLDYISLCSTSGYIFCPLVVTPCDYSRDVTYFFLIDNPVNSNYGLSIYDNRTSFSSHLDLLHYLLT